MKCLICGFPDTYEYDHTDCEIEDSEGCHPTKYDHFASIDQKSNEQNDDEDLY